MAENMGTQALTRFPELQAIRQAQNQLLIDPNFMRSAMSAFGGPQLGGAPQGGGQDMMTKDSLLTRMLNQGNPIQMRSQQPVHPGQRAAQSYGQGQKSMFQGMG